MSQAVTLRLDDDLARDVLALAHAVGGPAPIYPPHITLTLGHTAVPTQPLIERLAAIAATTDRLPVSISGLGVFPDGHGWLWLAPVTTAPLLALQKQVAEAIGPEHLDPLYRPGAWQPHVTVERGEIPIPDALGRLQTAWSGGLRGRAVTLEVVHFPPVEIVADLPLRA
ncbi:MAG: 2'-5' RNA ligase family protein [Zavarzinia sp.]|nr:2'-5' RNA ligase family protein [Zavarzinia sp.]